MIDTLKLCTTNFEINPELFPAATDTTTNILFSKQKYEFPILFDGSPEPVKIRISPDLKAPQGHRLFVNIKSMSILMGQKNNIKTAWKDDIKPALENLSQKLDEYGIYTKVDDMKVCRIDLACTMQMLNHPSTYAETFETSEFKRLKLDQFTNKNLVFKGYAEVVNIYDKTERQIQKREMSKNFIPPEAQNLLRYEHQYRNTEKIVKYLGISVVGQLDSNFGTLTSKLRMEITEQLAIMTDALQTIPANETNMLQAFMNSLQSCKHDEFLKQVGLYALMENSTGNIDQIFDIHMRLDKSQSHQRLKTHYKQLYASIKKFRLAFKLRNNPELITELLNKVNHTLKVFSN
jgi:hypothetical protein